MTGRKPGRPSPLATGKVSLSIVEILRATGGRLVAPAVKAAEAVGVSTDSRTIEAGELFIALEGPNHDGHRYVADAIIRGAAGAVVAEGKGLPERLPANAFLVEVPDTLAALGDIAMAYRRRHAIPLVAITGSNGKTTTKEMVASILSVGRAVLKSQGNFNNLVGVPLTLLELNSGHQAAVVELGMNHFGEIGRLSRICRPDVAVVTNVGPVHLEFLGDEDGVARAKAEILEGMKEDGVVVYNGDDRRLSTIFAARPKRTIPFSKVPGKAPVSLLGYRVRGGSRIEARVEVSGKPIRLRLNLWGLHNLENVLASCGASLALGVPGDEIVEGLESFSSIAHRSSVITLGGGITLIDDCYNANPRSMEAALALLSNTPARGRRVALLGDMLELGAASPPAHEDLGRIAVQSGLDLLIFVGRYGPEVERGARAAGMADSSFLTFPERETATDYLVRNLREGDCLLVKASRGMRLEAVVEEIVGRFNPGQ